MKNPEIDDIDKIFSDTVTKTTKSKTTAKTPGDVVKNIL